MTTTSSQVHLFLPSTEFESGHALDFSSNPSQVISGYWYIVASSLGLWKNRKTVAIRYTTTNVMDGIKFNDEIRYESCNNSKPPAEKEEEQDIETKWKKQEGFMTKWFGIKGTNSLQKHAKNGASFQWIGNGLLKLFHSKWQVIGYDQPVDPRWIVTYFEKPRLLPQVSIYTQEMLKRFHLKFVKRFWMD